MAASKRKPSTRRPRPGRVTPPGGHRRRPHHRRRTRIGVIVALGVVLLFAVAFIGLGDTNTNTNTTLKTASTKTTASTSTTVAPTTTTNPAAGPKPATAGGATTTATTAPAGSAFPNGSLNARSIPAVSSDCNAQPSGAAPGITTPASGNAVAIRPAPKSVGFPAIDGSSPHYTQFSSPPPFCIDSSKLYTATVTTDVGAFTIDLATRAAPVAVNSFVFLAGYHYFDGIVFNNVISGFIDQGGDPLGNGTGGPGYRFATEAPATAGAYVDGAVGMANSGPDTDGSQFFVDIGNQSTHVKPTYTVFGLVTSGMSVLQAINGGGSSGGQPTVTHHIVSVAIHETQP